MVTTVTLACDVQYWLSDPSIDVEVMWFRSEYEQNVGIKGEKLSTYATTSPSINNDNTTNLQSFLLIMNFGISDIGYYWCQMVVNNETLPPSPYGYIYSNHCVLQDVTCNMANQPLCAHTSTSQQMAHTMLNGQNCTLVDPNITIDGITTTVPLSNTASMMHTLMTSSAATSNVATDSVTLSEMNINTASNMHTTMTSPAATTVTVTDDDFTTTVFDTDSEVKCDFSKNGYKCSIGVMVSLLFFVIVLILGLTIGILIYCRKRKNKGKQAYADTV